MWYVPSQIIYSFEIILLISCSGAAKVNLE